ncbi:MAG: hypothetical protein ACRDRL_19965 [Sciscionella sp.]
MTLHLTPVELLAALGGLVIAVGVWRASVRRARRIATAARHSARLASLAGRVLATAALLGVTQWVLITHPGNTTLIAVALGLPDLLAGYVLARAITVTTVENPTRRGGEHR